VENQPKTKTGTVLVFAVFFVFQNRSSSAD
jgi:hypothetical protein